MLSIGLLANCIWGALSYHKAKGSPSWTTTGGEIIEAKMFDKSGVSSPVVYHFRIKYSYEVSGNKFISSRYAFGFDFLNHEANHIRSIDRNYSDQKKLMVFYDEDNPTESVIVPGMKYLGDKVWLNILFQSLMAFGILIFTWKINYFQAIFERIKK